MIALEADQRRRISTRVVNGEGQRYWMNIDVQDDPRDPDKKIFCFYDMSEVYDLRRQLDDRVRFRDLVGKSKAMQELYRHIRQTASVDANVLIEGETGTGKEFGGARHPLRQPAARPALYRGKLRRAHRGGGLYPAALHRDRLAQGRGRAPRH